MLEILKLNLFFNSLLNENCFAIVIDIVKSDSVTSSKYDKNKAKTDSY